MTGYTLAGGPHLRMAGLSAICARTSLGPVRDCAGSTGFAFERDIEDLFVRDCLAIFLGVGSVHDSSYGRLRNAAISLRATEL